MEHCTQIKLSKGHASLQNPPNGIDKGSWDDLCKAGEVLHLNSNTEFCKEGDRVDYVYIVLSGHVILRKNNKALDIIEPGESVGAGLLRENIANSVYPLSARTVKHVEVLKIPAAEAMRILKNRTSLGLYFMQQIQKRMGFLQNLNVISKLPVNIRVAHFLVHKEHLLSFSFMTRKLIAEILNTTTESVIRTTSEFLNMGMIKRKSKQIILTDKIHSLVYVKR